MTAVAAAAGMTVPVAAVAVGIAGALLAVGIAGALLAVAGPAAGAEAVHSVPVGCTLSAAWLGQRCTQNKQLHKGEESARKGTLDSVCNRSNLGEKSNAIDSLRNPAREAPEGSPLETMPASPVLWPPSRAASRPENGSGQLEAQQGQRQAAHLGPVALGSSGTESRRLRESMTDLPRSLPLACTRCACFPAPPAPPDALVKHGRSTRTPRQDLDLEAVATGPPLLGTVGGPRYTLLYFTMPASRYRRRPALYSALLHHVRFGCAAAARTSAPGGAPPSEMVATALPGQVVRKTGPSTPHASPANRAEGEGVPVLVETNAGAGKREAVQAQALASGSLVPFAPTPDASESSRGLPALALGMGPRSSGPRSS